MSVSYESKFKGNIRDTSKDRKFEHRTMGCAEESLPDPQQFLKKKSAPITNKLEKETSSLCKDRPFQRKSAVPNIRDAPKTGVRTEKNFIQTNALDAVLTVPKKPARNVVDDRFGDKFAIDSSGLAPKYIFKKVSSFFQGVCLVCTVFF